MLIDHEALQPLVMGRSTTFNGDCGYPPWVADTGIRVPANTNQSIYLNIYPPQKYGKEEGNQVDRQFPGDCRISRQGKDHSQVSW